MTRSRKKAAGLLALLLLVIAGGTLLLTGRARKPTRSPVPPETQAPVQVAARSYREKAIYHGGREGPLSGRMYGADRPVLLAQGRFIDLESGRPLSGLAPLKDIPAALCLLDGLSYGTLRLGEQGVLYQEFDPDGQPLGQPVALREFAGRITPAEDGSEIFIRRLQAHQDHLFVLSGTDRDPVLQVFRRDGSLYLSYDSVHGFDVDPAGYLYYASNQSSGGRSGYTKVELSSGEIVYESASSRQNGVMELQYVGDSRSVYLMTGSGVEVFEADTGLAVETVLHWERDTSLTEIFHRRRGFFVTPDGTIYISLCDPYDLFQGEESYTEVDIYRYSLEEYIPPEIETTLVLNAAYRDELIEAGILHYQRIHPEIAIEYNYAFQSRFDFERVYGKVEYGGQYAEQLAISILAGDAGDIVQTGGSRLAYRELFSTDAFLDVKDLLESDPSYPLLNRSAVNGLVIDGAIRGVPLGASNTYIEMNRALYDTLGVGLDYHNLKWSDVLDLFAVWKRKYPDRPFISVPDDSIGPLLHMQSLLRVNMPDLIDLADKRVDLRQQWFLDLLSGWKAACQDPMFIKRFDAKSGSYLDWLKGGLFCQNGTGNAYQDMLAWYGLLNQIESIDSVYLPMFRGEIACNRVANSRCLYSISNSSEHKDEAWQFLSFLLTTDQQMNLVRDNHLNLEARERAFQTRAFYGQVYGEKTEEFFASMRELQDKIDYLYDMDYYIQDLSAPLMDYVTGKLTLDQAIDRAEQSIWIRLNE